MLPNVAVVSGWCNKISVSVIDTNTRTLRSQGHLQVGGESCQHARSHSRNFILGTHKLDTELYA